MKTDNLVNGKYFAGLMKEVFADLEDAKYTNLELRSGDLQACEWKWNFEIQVVNLRTFPAGVGQPSIMGRSPFLGKLKTISNRFPAVSNNVYSDHNRWMIQVPRLYDIYRCFQFPP